MRFLRPFECFPGMFQGLLGELVSRQVILFPVVRCRSAMRVCRQFMKFRSSLVEIVWHLWPPSSLLSLFSNQSLFQAVQFRTLLCFLRNLLSAPYSIAISFPSLARKGQPAAQPNANTAVLKLLLSTDGSILAKA